MYSFHAVQIATSLTRLPFGSLRAFFISQDGRMNTSLFLSLRAMPVSAPLASLSGNQSLQVQWFARPARRIRDAGPFLLCRWSGGLAFARYFFRP